MKKIERKQVEYAIADLEAFREFALIPEIHRPKLDRAIERLQKLANKS